MKALALAALAAATLVAVPASADPKAAPAPAAPAATAPAKAAPAPAAAPAAAPVIAIPEHTFHVRLDKPHVVIDVKTPTAAAAAGAAHESFREWMVRQYEPHQ
jgi:hypothetical protein